MAVTDSSEHQTPELDASSSSPDTVAGGMVAEATNAMQCQLSRPDHIQAPSLGDSTGLDSSNWRGYECDELKWAILDNGPVCCTNYSCNGAQ